MDTVAFDKFGQPLGALIEDCKATPKETLWQVEAESQEVLLTTSCGNWEPPPNVSARSRGWHELALGLWAVPRHMASRMSSARTRWISASQNRLPSFSM